MLINVMFVFNQKFVENPANDNDHASLNNCIHDSNKLFDLQSSTVIPVKVDSIVKSGLLFFVFVFSW